MEFPEKILTLEQAEAAARAARAAGETVVLCHGCFDIVHPGHVRHLRQARRLGDRLIVTITGDALVNKDTGRPLIPQELRAENLAALDAVDWVAVNPAPTAVELLRRLRPDVYVKGREYEQNRDPRFEAEKAAVEGYGGRLVFSSGDVVFSSTALISAMEQAHAPAQGRLRALLEREQLDERRADAIVESFRGRRVAVLGAAVIDTYVLCDRAEVSAEGPIMALRPLEERSFDGGAAGVARHLAAMGARPLLVTVVPDDAAGGALARRLEGCGVEVRAVGHAAPVPERRRFVVGTSKVVLLDRGRPPALDAAQRRRLLETARDAAREAGAMIVADHGTRLLSAAATAELCAAARPHAALLAGGVAGRRASLKAMAGMDLLCAGEPDLREALQDYDGGLTAVAWKLLHATSSRAAIVTLGGDGAAAFENRAGAALREDDWQTRLASEFVPALAPCALDELGCGDALLAAAALARAAGGTLTLAAVLGAVASAAASQRLGNSAVGAADLRRGLRRLLAAQLTCGEPPVVSPIASVADDQLRPAHA